MKFNVAVTRAKERLFVVGSLKISDSGVLQHGRVEFVVELLQKIESFKAFKDFASKAKPEKIVGAKFDYEVGDEEEKEEEKKATEADEMEENTALVGDQDAINQVDKAIRKMKLNGKSSTAASTPEIHEWLQRPRF